MYNNDGRSPVGVFLFTALPKYEVSAHLHLLTYLLTYHYSGAVCGAAATAVRSIDGRIQHAR